MENHQQGADRDVGVFLLIRKWGILWKTGLTEQK